MGLLKESSEKIFDAESIHRGTLIYAKHYSWEKGQTGIVSAVRDDLVTVRFHPEISNVTNHYFIPAEEVVSGQWEIRWSEDLTSVNEYPGEEE